MADPASNLLSDALMGKPTDQSDEPSAVSLPSTEIPIPPSATINDSLQATPVPIVPGKPLEAVSPVVVSDVTPPSVSSLPIPPKKGIPTPVLGGLALLAVMAVGVAVALTLSGESQELRQKAYLPPEAAVVATPRPTTEPTIDQSFQAFQRQYPSAQSVTLSGEVNGVAHHVIDETVGFRQFFIELSAASDAEGKEYFSWVETTDNVFLLSQFTSAGGKAYASGVIPSTYNSGTIIISKEIQGSETYGLIPTEKVINVSF